MDPVISCAGGCGAGVVEPAASGWEYLEVSQRWRCGPCTRVLQSLSQPYEDTMPDLTNPAPGQPHGDPVPGAVYTSTKAYFNFPCAHRQHRHDGVCRQIHGYSRSFHFVFGARELDECGFVVDFGKLRWLKEHLDFMFDHTLLLNEDDPLLPAFRALETRGACAIRMLPYGVGMEGTARYLYEIVNGKIRDETNGRCWVVSVESRENDKNSGIYTGYGS